MIYHKNNPRVTLFRVNSGFTRLMSSIFGETLREKLSAAGITAAELSRRSKVTKQNIGRILNNTPHSITGASPKVEAETVVKLAEPLGWDVNEALMMAGHAPTTGGYDDGIFAGIHRLKPERQVIAKRQISAIIDALADEEHDTDYIDDEKK